MLKQNTASTLFATWISGMKDDPNWAHPETGQKPSRTAFNNVNFEANAAIFSDLLDRLQTTLGIPVDPMASDNQEVQAQYRAEYWDMLNDILIQLLPKITKEHKNYTSTEQVSEAQIERVLLKYPQFKPNHLAHFTKAQYQGGGGVQRDFMAGQLRPSTWFRGQDADVLFRLIEMKGLIHCLSFNPETIAQSLSLHIQDKKRSSGLHAIPFILNKGADLRDEGNHWIAVTVYVDFSNNTLSAKITDSLLMSEAEASRVKTVLQEALSSVPNFQVSALRIDELGVRQSNGYSCFDLSLYHILSDLNLSEAQANNPLVSSILSTGGLEKPLRKVLLQALLDDIQINDSVLAEVNDSVKGEFKSADGTYCLPKEYTERVCNSLSDTIDFKPAAQTQTVAPVVDVSSKAIEARAALFDLQDEAQEKAAALVQGGVLQKQSGGVIEVDFFQQIKDPDFLLWLSQLVSDLNDHPSCHEMRIKNLSVLQGGKWPNVSYILGSLRHITKFSVQSQFVPEDMGRVFRVIETINKSSGYRYSSEDVANFSEYKILLDDIKISEDTNEIQLNFGDYIKGTDTPKSAFAKLALLVERLNLLLKEKEASKFRVIFSGSTDAFNPSLYELTESDYFAAIFARLSCEFQLPDASFLSEQVINAVNFRNAQPFKTALDESNADVQAKIIEASERHLKENMQPVFGSVEIDLSGYFTNEHQEIALQALIETLNRPDLNIKTISFKGVDSIDEDLLKSVIRGLTTVTDIQFDSRAAAYQSVATAICLRNGFLQYLNLYPVDSKHAWFLYFESRMNQRFGVENARTNRKSFHYLLNPDRDRETGLFASSSVDFFRSNNELVECVDEFLKGLLSAFNACSSVTLPVHDFQIGLMAFSAYSVESTWPEAKTTTFLMRAMKVLSEHVQAGGHIPFKQVSIWLPNKLREESVNSIPDAYLDQLFGLLRAMHDKKTPVCVKLITVEHASLNQLAFTDAQLERLITLYKDEAIVTDLQIDLTKLSEAHTEKIQTLQNIIAKNRRAYNETLFQNSKLDVVSDEAPTDINEGSANAEDMFAFKLPHVSGSSQMPKISIGVDVEAETEVQVQTAQSFSADQAHDMEEIEASSIEMADPNIVPEALITLSDIKEMGTLTNLHAIYSTRRNFAPPEGQEMAHTLDSSTMTIVKPKTAYYFLRRLMGATVVSANDNKRYFLRQYPMNLHALTPTALTAVVEQQVLFEGTINIDQLPDGFFVSEYKDANHKTRLFLDYNPLRVVSVKHPMRQKYLPQQDLGELRGDLRQFLTDDQIAEYMLTFDYPPEDRSGIVNGFARLGDRSPKQVEKLQFILRKMLGTENFNRFQEAHGWLFDEALKNDAFLSSAHECLKLLSVFHENGFAGLMAFCNIIKSLKNSKPDLYQCILRNFVHLPDHVSKNFAQLCSLEAIQALNELEQMNAEQLRWWNTLVDRHFAIDQDGVSSTGYQDSFLELFHVFKTFLKRTNGLPLPPLLAPAKGTIPCDNMPVFLGRVLTVLEKNLPQYRLKQLKQIQDLDWDNHGAYYAAKYNGYRFVHKFMRLNKEYVSTKSFRIFCDVLGLDYGSPYQLTSEAILKLFPTFVAENPDEADKSQLVVAKDCVTDLLNKKDVRILTHVKVLFHRMLGTSDSPINIGAYDQYKQLQKLLDVGEEGFSFSGFKGRDKFSDLFVRFKIQLHVIAAIGCLGSGNVDLTKDIAAFKQFLEGLNYPSDDVALYNQLSERNRDIAEKYLTAGVKKPTLSQMTALLRFSYALTREDFNYFYGLSNTYPAIDWPVILEAWHQSGSSLSAKAILTAFLMLHQNLQEEDLMVAPDDIAKKIDMAFKLLVKAIYPQNHSSCEIDVARLLGALKEILIGNEIHEAEIFSVLLKYQHQGDPKDNPLKSTKLIQHLNELSEIEDLKTLRIELGRRFPIKRKQVAQLKNDVKQSADLGLFDQCLLDLAAQFDASLSATLEQMPEGVELSVQPIGSVTKDTVLEKLSHKFNELRAAEIKVTNLTEIPGLSDTQRSGIKAVMSFIGNSIKIDTIVLAIFSSKSGLKLGAVRTAIPILSKKPISDIVDETNRIIQDTITAVFCENAAMRAFVEKVFGPCPSISIMTLPQDLQSAKNYFSDKEVFFSALHAFIEDWEGQGFVLDAQAVERIRSIPPNELAVLFEALSTLRHTDALRALVFSDQAFKNPAQAGQFVMAIKLIAEVLSKQAFDPKLYEAIFNPTVFNNVDQLENYTQAVVTILSDADLPVARKRELIDLAVKNQKINIELVIGKIQFILDKQPLFKHRLLGLMVKLASDESTSSAQFDRALNWIGEFGAGDPIVNAFLDYYADKEASEIHALFDQCAGHFRQKSVLRMLSKSDAFADAAKLFKLMSEQFAALETLYASAPYPSRVKLNEILDKKNNEDAFKEAIDLFDRDPAGQFNDAQAFEALYQDELKQEIPRIIQSLGLYVDAVHSRKLLPSEQADLLNALVYVNDLSQHRFVKMSSQALKEQFVIYRDALRQGGDKDSQYKNTLELIALLREVYRRASGGKLPRLVQLLPIILSLGESSFARIKTGEGKTIVTGFQAVMRHVLGGPVLVASSNAVLAHEGLAENKAFFDSLGIESVEITDKSTDDDFKEDGIHYGDLSNMALFMQRYEFRLNGKADALSVHVLYDEVDRAIVDETSTFKYSSNLTGQLESKDKPILLKIFDFVNDPKFLARKSTAKQDLAAFRERVSKSRSLSTEAKALVAQYSDEYLSELFIDAYKAAHIFKHPIDLYRLRAIKSVNKEGDAVVQCAVGVMNNRRVAPDNARFSRHVHAIMQAVVAREFTPIDPDKPNRCTLLSEFKEQFPGALPPIVPAKRSTLSELNANAFALRYLKQHPNATWFGLSGTLEADAFRSMSQAAGVHCYEIPPFQASKMETVFEVAETRELIRPASRFKPAQWSRKKSAEQAHIDRIVEIALRAHGEGNPIVIFPENEAMAAKIQQAFKDKGLSKLTNYMREVGDTLQDRITHEAGIVLAATGEGKITLSNLTDRGSDFKVTDPNKKLVLIVPSLFGEADDRGLWQRFGRTARNGHPGTAYLVLSEAEFSSRGVAVPNNQEDNVKEAIAKVRATFAESHGINWLLQNRKAQFLSQVQDAYILLMKGLKQILQNQFDAMDLQADFPKQWKVIQQSAWRIWAGYLESLTSKLSAIEERVLNATKDHPEQLEATLDKQLEAVANNIKEQTWHKLCGSIVDATNEVYESVYDAHMNHMADDQDKLITRVAATVAGEKPVDKMALSSKMDKLNREIVGIDKSLQTQKQAFQSAKQALERLQNVGVRNEGLFSSFRKATFRAATDVELQAAQKKVSTYQDGVKACQEAIDTRRQLVQQIKTTLKTHEAAQNVQEVTDGDYTNDYAIAPKLTLEMLKPAMKIDALQAKPDYLPKPVKPHQSVNRYENDTVSIPSVASAEASILKMSSAKARLFLDVVSELNHRFKFPKGPSSLDPDLIFNLDSESNQYQIANQWTTNVLGYLLNSLLQSDNPLSIAAIKRDYWRLIDAVKQYGNDGSRAALRQAHVAFIQALHQAEKEETDNQYFNDAFDLPGTNALENVRSLKHQLVALMYRFSDKGLFEPGAAMPSKAGLFTGSNRQSDLVDGFLDFAKHEINLYRSEWFKSSDRRVALRQLRQAFNTLQTNKNNDNCIAEFLAELSRLDTESLNSDSNANRTRRFRSLRNTKGSRFHRLLNRLHDRALGLLSADESLYQAQVGSIEGAIKALAQYQGLGRYNSDFVSTLMETLSAVSDLKADTDQNRLSALQALLLLKSKLHADLNTKLSRATVFGDKTGKKANAPIKLPKNLRGFVEAIETVMDRIDQLTAAVQVSELRGITNDVSVRLLLAVQGIAGQQDLSNNINFSGDIANRYDLVKKSGFEDKELLQRLYELLHTIESVESDANTEATIVFDQASLDQGNLTVTYRRILDDAETPCTLSVQQFATDKMHLSKALEQGASRPIEKPNRVTTADILASLPKPDIKVSKELQKLLVAIVAEYQVLEIIPDRSCRTNLERVFDLLKDKAHVVEVYDKISEKMSDIDDLIALNTDLLDIFLSDEFNITSLREKYIDQRKGNLGRDNLCRSESFDSFFNREAKKGCGDEVNKSATPEAVSAADLRVK